VAQASTTLVVVEVEPWVLPVGAGTEVGWEPTTAVDAGASAGATVDEAGKWGHDGTPSSISGEHYRTELQHPSSSLPPR
jgi:hypothetical protein